MRPDAAENRASVPSLCWRLHCVEVAMRSASVVGRNSWAADSGSRRSGVARRGPRSSVRD